jgi:cyclopropane-fatty-acyl-phospholipid synthase
MTYSGALFAPGDDLHSAQIRKIEAILDRARIRDGSTMLEIGTGWGELAIRAARRGARVTTLTLSREQRDFVARRIDAEALGDRIDLQLKDYRHAEGRYDAVISVEMVEAVGSEYWPEYFASLDRVLAPEGTIVLQAITMPHDRMLATRNVQTWIGKYVFPGGEIPSVRAIEHELARTGLHVVDRASLGRHYAQTLSEWRFRFLARRDEVAALGFDEDFQRLWEYYLAYSEAGFRSGFLDVWQFQVSR